MDNRKKYFFDHQRNVKRLLLCLYFVCGLLFALDFLIHRHVSHSWENVWGFYPVYGFVGCVVLVLIARWMRTFLMRPYDYYNSEDCNKNKVNDSYEKASNVEASELEEKTYKNNSKKIGGHYVDD